LIVEFLQVHLSTEVRMTADLSNKDYYSHPFCLQDCKPDIVVWNPSLSEVWIRANCVLWHQNFSSLCLEDKEVHQAGWNHYRDIWLLLWSPSNAGWIERDNRLKQPIRPALQQIQCPKSHIWQLFGFDCHHSHQGILQNLLEVLCNIKHMVLGHM
jgi:hypothetical protein